MKQNWLLWLLFAVFVLALGVSAIVSRRDRIEKTRAVCSVIAGVLETRVREEIAAGRPLKSEAIVGFVVGLRKPNNRAGLIYADFQGRPLDRWGNPLVITSDVSASRVRIEVRSSGADEVTGTEDDLMSEAVIALQAEKND